ncbi:MAG: hypothetical protein JNK11_16100 [Alphaproteobacteria bacterium]|nr:hypothetical protein [Alphaproteobacteria bacterium]
MNEEALNMSLRKFLKTVGVTAQREIETAVREAVRSGRISADKPLQASVLLTVDGVGLQARIGGEILLK